MMLLLLLALGGAAAEPLPDAETQRLLGPPPEAAPGSPSVAAPAPTGSLGLGWPLAGLAIGGALVYVARSRALSPLTPAAEVRVIGRAVLTKDSTVSLLEVRDAEGRWRRLLVGSGGQGPQLLTGLGHQPATASPSLTAGSAASAASTPVSPEVTALEASFGLDAFDGLDAGSLNDLPEVPAYPVPPTPSPLAHVLTTPPPVQPRVRAPSERPSIARGAPPARSYAEVAAALQAEPSAPTTPRAESSAVARPQQSQAAEPVAAPVTSAREVLAMIEREKRRRVAD